MILRELLGQLRQQLAAAGSPSPAADLRCLACHVLGCSVSMLYVQDSQEVPPEATSHLEELVRRRCAGEPVAYLTGTRAFWSLELACRPCTLIPRPDTETLVEEALKRAPRGGRVLDLGTGTGAVALALKTERPDLQITGTDISMEAVELAGENARRNGLDVCFAQGSWYEAAKGRYDLIVANPPYIREDDPHLSRGDVRFEPRSALVAGGGGLSDLRAVIAGAPGYLTDGGWVLVEHGWDQGEQVREIFALHGYREIGTVRDLGGNPRVTGGLFFAGGETT